MLKVYNTNLKTYNYYLSLNSMFLINVTNILLVIGGTASLRAAPANPRSHFENMECIFTLKILPCYGR